MKVASSYRVIATEITPRGRKSIEQLRKEYAAIQQKFLKWISRETLAAAVRCQMAKIMAEKNKKKPSPEMWVEAIKKVTVACDHCDGSGQYKWGGTVNGRPKFSNTCFRCKGKGRMDADDCSRTATYHSKLKVFG